MLTDVLKISFGKFDDIDIFNSISFFCTFYIIFKILFIKFINIFKQCVLTNVINANMLTVASTTTTTIYFNEVVFPSALGLTLPMAFPQHSPPPSPAPSIFPT